MYRKPSEERSRTKLLTSLLLVAVFLVTGAILLFNRNGFMAITEIQEDVQLIVTENQQVRLEIDSMNSIIQLLETDSLYMEKRIREILGWGYPGETVIKFINPENE